MAGPSASARPRAGLLAAGAALVLAVAVALAVAALTATRSKGTAPTAAVGGHNASSAPAVVTTTPPIPKVKVAVASAAKGVQPWSKPVHLTVAHGTLLSLTASDDTGVALGGALTASGWTSSGVVVPSRTYLLQAYVRGLDGTAAYHTLKVKTSPPNATVAVRVNLQIGPAVGVGWPITVHFTKPVTNRLAVQNALVLETSVPVTGAWHWFSDTEVHYRPKTYWPAHTTITLHRNLEGLETAPGVWGQTANDVHFTVGDTHVTTVDVATQHMTVTVNGRQVLYVGVSTGRKTLPTLGGVHIVLEKFAVKEMKSDTLVPPIPQYLNGRKNPAYYDEKELWATRISYAGAFVHYNPDTVKVQGIAAASHGCVNTELAPAKQFYDLSLPGDVVNVVHSPAAPNRTDPGMMDWNYSWSQWVAGSATGA